MTFSYDDSCWPILVVTAPPRPVEDAELRMHLRRLGAWLDRGVCAVIIDNSRAPAPTLKQAALTAQARADDEKRYPGRQLVRVVVGERGPFATVDSAFAFCLARVAQHAAQAPFDARSGAMPFRRAA